MNTKKAKATERAERAAALLAEQKRRERRRRFLSIGGVVAVMLLVIGGIVVFQILTKEEVEAPEASEYSLVIGPEDAPHSLVVYEDFLCPVCKAFESAANEKLNDLAADGQVRLEYRPISIFDDFSWSADSLNAFFVVQDASGDEVAKAFHDLLFDNQPAEQGPYPSIDDLVAMAVEAGAVEADVRPGIEGNAKSDEVEAAGAEADAAGLRGTPTILLDGEQFDDGGSWEEIADNLAAEIED